VRKRAVSVDWSHPALRRQVGGSDEAITSPRRPSLDRSMASFNTESGRKSNVGRMSRVPISNDREKLPRSHQAQNNPPRTTHLEAPPRNPPPQPLSAARLEEDQRTIKGPTIPWALEPITETESARNSISVHGQSFESNRSGQRPDGAIRSTGSPKVSLERLRTRTSTSSPKTSIDLEAARDVLARGMSTQQSMGGGVAGKGIGGLPGSHEGVGLRGGEREVKVDTAGLGLAGATPAGPDVQAVKAILAKSSWFN
jgi:hypothetical protein